ncbi:MAG: Rrf2 family transcriptional regulator [Patescibacteria group bacterium]|nr:Rrf2 family transcriptional regulator [Patescibacteria group bacterium]
MKFSTRAEYGLKAMVNLALDFPKVKSVKEIAHKENISQKYLERLIGELRRKKLVKSHKGRNGGYTLSSNPKKIKVGKIIEILEGPLLPLKCQREECVGKHCLSKKVWMVLWKQIKRTLYNIKLDDLVK